MIFVERRQEAAWPSGQHVGLAIQWSCVQVSLWPQPQCFTVAPYLGVTTDAKWSWKPHISNLLRKLSHRLSLFNHIFHMLEYRTHIAFYNGLVLPHLDYADTLWGDQPGLKSEMEKLQSFQNKFARKIKLCKTSSSEALKCLTWLPLAGRRLSH